MDINRRKKDLLRKCPICHCPKGIILSTVRMNLPNEFALPESYDVVSCEGCGFTFADTKASQEDYQHYYRSCNFYSDTGRVKKDLYEETHENDAQQIQKYCRKEDSILDIGCGNAGILQLLAKNGYQHLYGMDPSEQTIEYLLSIGLKGEVGDIYSEIPVRWKHQFDFIICTAVLEHLLFLEDAVKQMQKYLKPNGRLYVTVPGIEGFAIYKNMVPDYFNQEHINYFNKYGLDFLMKSSGFQRVSLTQEDNYVVHSKPPEFVLSAVYENTGKPEIGARNEFAEREISNYFTYHEEREVQMLECIQTIIESNQRIAIWGTGASAMWLLENNKQLAEQIEYYVDNNTLKSGKKFFGKIVYLPEKLQKDSEIFILICVMINVDKVKEQMKELNIKNSYYVLGDTGENDGRAINGKRTN